MVKQTKKNRKSRKVRKSRSIRKSRKLRKSKTVRKSKTMRKSRYRTHREGGGWFTSKYSPTQQMMLKPIRNYIKYLKGQFEHRYRGLMNDPKHERKFMNMLVNGLELHILRIVKQCIKQKNYTDGAKQLKSSKEYKEKVVKLFNMMPNLTLANIKHFICSSYIESNKKDLFNIINNQVINNEAVKELDNEDNIKKCKSDIDNIPEIKEIYELLLVDPSKLVLKEDVGVVGDEEDEDDEEDYDDATPAADAAAAPADDDYFEVEDEPDNFNK